MLTHENLDELEELKKHYPTAKALTLPVLWMIQNQYGWISPNAMKYVAELLNLPMKQVYGVVTFYTMFNVRPVGRFHLQVCTNVSCMLRGAQELSQRVCNRLGVKLGETTADDRFTVSEVECLGSCGTAPMMQVNERYYEDLTNEKVESLLTELSRR